MPLLIMADGDADAVLRIIGFICEPSPLNRFVLARYSAAAEARLGSRVPCCQKRSARTMTPRLAALANEQGIALR